MYRFLLLAMAAVVAVFAVGCAAPAASSPGDLTPTPAGAETPGVTPETETPASTPDAEAPAATPGTTALPLATPGAGSAGTIDPDVTDRALEWLATEANVSAESLRLVSAEPAEWTDSCFGLGGPAESCLAAMTPGWLITFEAGGQQYEVRTDEAGTNFRLVPQAS